MFPGATGTPGTGVTVGSPPLPAGASAALADEQQVRVSDAEVIAGPADALTRRVRACVYLGRLLPLDVVVELVDEREEREEREEGEPVSPAIPPRRMWSECPLANGSYVFETQLPQREVDAAHHLSVIVRRCTPLQDARIAPVLHRRTVSVSDSR